MADLYSIMYMLETSGVYQYFLPFLLIFVILFAILEKTFIFGKNSDNSTKTSVNLVVAIIISLFLIVQTDLILFMFAYLSRMAMFIIIGIMFMLVVAMFFGTKDSKKFEGFGMTAGVVIAIVALLWSLSSSTYGAAFPYWFYISESTISAVLLVAVLVIVIGLVAKSSKTQDHIKIPYRG